jgi:putative membrane protein
VTPKDRSLLGDIAVYLVVGLILALVNAVIKPVIRILTLPLYIITFGLFALIVNAAMLELVSKLTSLTSIGLHIETFGTAVLASLLLSILTLLISIPFRSRIRPA